MKDDHKLDQLFREGLADHPTPTPEYLWDGIEARRFGAKAAKNTNKYWLLLLLLFISVGGYGTWMFINVDTDETAFNQKDTTYSINSAATNNKSSNSNEEAKKVSSSNSLSKTAESTKTIRKNQANTNIAPSNTPKTTKKSSKQEKETKAAQKAEKRKAKKADRSAINNNSVNEKNNHVAHNVASWKLGNAKSTPFSTNQELVYRNNQGQKKSTKASSILANRNSYYEISSLHSVGQSNFREILLDDKFTLEKKRIKKKVPEECYSFLPSRHRVFTFEAYYGPDYNIRTLTEKSETVGTSENFGHFVARDTSESRWYSHSAGIRINYYFKGGLHLKTGINATRISERFDYKQDEGRTTLHSTIIDTIYYPNDSVRYVYSDDEVLQVGERVVVTHVKHRFIDIPILLGYELELPNRFSFSLTGGVLVNLLYLKKGNMVGPTTNQPTPYSPNNGQNSEFFTRRAGLSAYGSFITYYKWRSNMHFMLEPSVRHYIKPLTKSSYELEQRYFSASLKLGMRFVF